MIPWSEEVAWDSDLVQSEFVSSRVSHPRLPYVVRIEWTPLSPFQCTGSESHATEFCLRQGGFHRSATSDLDLLSREGGGPKNSHRRSSRLGTHRADDRRGDQSERNPRLCCLDPASWRARVFPSVRQPQPSAGSFSDDGRYRVRHGVNHQTRGHGHQCDDPDATRPAAAGGLHRHPPSAV